MKQLLLLTISVVIATAIHAQELYSKAFGEAENPALIFLHGGPGYNSANFEGTTAERLADEGFYVIVYDRRGEGRSKALAAKYNFEESFEDILSLYEQYEIESATLLGHSFGGVLGSLFAEQHQDKVDALVLIGVPVVLQETFKTIIDSSKAIYETNKDENNLKYIEMLQKMDTTSLMYSAYCFGHAMQNGFYSVDSATQESKEVYVAFSKDADLLKHSSEMSFESPQGFWKNEQYTTIDVTDNLKKLVKNGLPIYGLYGKEDGLYSAKQIENIKSIITSENVLYLENCSHNVFIDRQTAFVEALKKWVE